VNQQVRGPVYEVLHSFVHTTAWSMPITSGAGKGPSHHVFPHILPPVASTVFSSRLAMMEANSSSLRLATTELKAAPGAATAAKAAAARRAAKEQAQEDKLLHLIDGSDPGGSDAG
jgi:hypothetical protein